jgi:hypothetical protein
MSKPSSPEAIAGFNAGIYQSAHFLNAIATDLKQLDGDDSRDARLLEEIARMLTYDFIETEN